jgi:hypothetical protein
MTAWKSNCAPWAPTSNALPEAHAHDHTGPVQRTYL